MKMSISHGREKLEISAVSYIMGVKLCLTSKKKHSLPGVPDVVGTLIVVTTVVDTSEIDSYVPLSCMLVYQI